MAWRCDACSFPNKDPAGTTCEFCGEARASPVLAAAASASSADIDEPQRQIEQSVKKLDSPPAFESEAMVSHPPDRPMVSHPADDEAPVTPPSTASQMPQSAGSFSEIAFSPRASLPTPPQRVSSGGGDEDDDEIAGRRKDSSEVDLDEVVHEAEAPPRPPPTPPRPPPTPPRPPAMAPAPPVPRRTPLATKSPNTASTSKGKKQMSVVASYSVCSDQGRRRSMEDVYMVNMSIQDDNCKSYFGVFDGHAGSRAAEYCGQRMLDNITSTAAWRRGDLKEAMRYGIQRTEQSYLRAALSASPRWFDGTTAVATIVSGSTAVLGWVGDSRATLGRYVDGAWDAVELTQDHKPMSPPEHERIISTGGTVGRSLKEASARSVTAAAGSRCPVFCFGAHPQAPMRCYPGGLSLSRSIGDVTLKYHSTKCVIGEPEIVSVKLDLSKDRFLILGCDGIWDVLTNEQAVNIVANAAVKKQDAARSLVQAAYAKGSTDNMTAIVVRLNTSAKMMNAAAP